MVVTLEIALPAPLVLVMPALGLLVLLVLALGLVLLLPLALPALVPAGTRAQRLQELKRREPDEASGLARGWLPRLQGAAAAVEA